jgi:hypothetical protein
MPFVSLILIKTFYMSKSTMQQQGQNKTVTKRPENKDNLDSRKNEEFLTKGDDITHNKKEVHNKPRKGK